MKPEFTRLRQEEESHHAQTQTEIADQNKKKEFASVEELLRYDSQTHPVPSDLAERVNASIAAEIPPPAKPWYKKIWE